MVNRRRSPRRSTSWFDTKVGQDIANGTSALLDLLPSGENLEGFTVTRVIVGITLMAAVPQVVTSEMQLSYGIGVASETAFALGVTALPNAESAGDFPERGWVVRGSFVVADDINGPTPPLVRWNEDLRAQRKVENGMMYLLLKNDTIRGTVFNVRATGWVRTLCLRP